MIPSFPSAQFQIDRYTVPYHLSRNRNGEGLLLYVWDDIPSKVLDDKDSGSETEAIGNWSNVCWDYYNKIKWLI